MKTAKRAMIDRAADDLPDEKGASAVEYGLMVALIAAVIIGVVMILGQALPGGFQTVINSI